MHRDEFNRLTRDRGPGGYTCYCCGPEGSKTIQRRRVRRLLRRVDRRAWKEGEVA